MLDNRKALNLKRILDRFYREYNYKARLTHDPVEFPRRYSSPEDIEVAGFIASAFAYGKIDLFKPVIEKLLKPGGRHPANFFAGFKTKRDRKYLSGISYRFNKEADVLCLVHILGQTLRSWGSLRALFYNYFNPEQADTGEAIGGFMDSLLGADTSAVYGKNIMPPGLKQLLPHPFKGSACKRMNLFLRWMVRTRDMDLGVWDEVPASKLIIPLDTHIARISKCLGLTKRASSDLKTAREITLSLKKLDPEDPLKYDFALCHLGISGVCSGKSSAACAACAVSA